METLIAILPLFAAGLIGYGQLRNGVKNNAKRLDTKVGKDVFKQVDDRLKHIEEIVVRILERD